MGEYEEIQRLQRERAYLSAQLEEATKELARLDLLNLTLTQQKRQAIAAFNFIKIMQEKVEKAFTLDALYLNVVKAVTSDLFMDSSALLKIDYKTREVSTLASVGLPENVKGLKLDEDISDQEILKPTFANSKSSLKAFHKFVVNCFKFPYFVWYPIADEGDGTLVLFVGNKFEDLMSKQPFSEASLETFGAISSVIFLRKDNITKTQEMLRKKEEKIDFLAEILKTSPVSVIAANKDAKITYCNPAAEKLFGYNVEELVGKDTAVLNAEPNATAIQKEILDTVRQGEVWKGEMQNKKKNGDLFYIHASIYQLQDKEGNFIAMIGFQEDITERKKLEAQLLHAQKMEAVGQLAGGVAHDFNNILTAIIGYGSLLKMKMTNDDPLRHNVDQILASSERGANLTQSLLAFGRKQIINLKPIKLNEIVKRVEKLLLRLIGEDIELKTILNPPTPPFDKGGQEGIGDLIIMADSSQIEQVLMNLATNARDAMPDGGLFTITTELAELDEKYLKTHGYGELGMYALISVSDTGEGLDERTKERIFEPFFTTKDVGRGTGLGLAIVYGIVKQHNGYINAYSELGKGTTFKIYLPLIKAEVEEIKPATVTTMVGGTETILIAEDDTEVRRFTKNILEEFGYKVIEAVDGEDAINKFMENKDKIQFLLFDVVMPKKNGKEAYEEIKKVKSDIKTLFISGYPADVIHKKGIIEEGLNLVLKPILPPELLRKVREGIGSCW